MKLVIILPGPEPKEILDKLRKDHKHLTVEYHHYTNDTKLPEDVYKDADYLFTLATVPEDPRKQAPKLKWVHCKYIFCPRLHAIPANSPSLLCRHQCKLLILTPIPTTIQILSYLTPSPASRWQAHLDRH